MISSFFESLYGKFSSIPFDMLVLTVWGSYLLIFVAAFIICLKSKSKPLCKRPFLCLTNAYAGVNLALFMISCSFGSSIFATALFWVVGYMLYGLLCLIGSKRPRNIPEIQPQSLTSSPTVPPKPMRADVPAAKNGVRLEHALSITDKLLMKNLGKGDRQELEKLKSTLSVLRIKGTLSPEEAEMLNDNFNMLLKLMAKYNV